MTNENGQYDIHIEIDIDCEELVDACGLKYTRSLDDNTQNVVIITLDKDEYKDTFSTIQYWFNDANERKISQILLNEELSEYTTKVTIYKPSGDVICFY